MEGLDFPPWVRVGLVLVYASVDRSAGLDGVDHSLMD